MAISILSAGQSIHLLHYRPTIGFQSPGSAVLRSTRLFPPSFSPPSSAPSLPIQSAKPYPVKIKASTASRSPIPLPNTPTDTTNLLSDSTRTISSLLASAVVLSKLVLRAVESISLKIRTSVTTFNSPTLDELSQINALKNSLACSVGPLFFAAVSTGAGSRVNTPASLVAGAVVKWLDIYGGILMIRVLLSWFPNIPWDRQPLSAIRDLCDPYLNLFRGIIPPLFNTLDISPMFAFLALGSISSILANTRRA